MHKIFIDTNVILDCLIKRDPFQTNSLKIISLIEKKKVKGFISPIVIANAYYILSKIKNKNYALDKI